MLYARAITLRNCGRFTVVASDFGSDYRTHTHVTSEALYASLTRGATWKPQFIDLKRDLYAFTRSYEVAAMPLWFLPGVFGAEGNHRLPDAYLDTTAFNVVNELYPSTSKAYALKSSGWEEKDRPFHVPTYGTIQAIKPDRRLVTCAISRRPDLLESFCPGQTFLLGKKRTMVQIVELSPTVEGKAKQGRCATGWLEFSCHAGEFWQHFEAFEILAATMRYLVLRGTTRKDTDYVEFAFGSEAVCIPDFYVQLLRQEGLL